MTLSEAHKKFVREELHWIEKFRESVSKQYWDLLIKELGREVFHIAFDMTLPLMNGKSFPKTAYCGKEYEHGEKFFVPGNDIVEMDRGWVILTGEPMDNACLSCLHRFEAGVEKHT